jgi:septal ring factor EnvC (AmiA/AmiB activator)
MEISRFVSDLNSLNSDRTRLKTDLRELASRDKEQSLLEGRLKQLEQTNRELIAKLKQTEQKLPNSRPK